METVGLGLLHIIAASVERCFDCLQVRITGPAAKVMTVRVAVTQKLRERIPAIAAVQLVT